MFKDSFKNCKVKGDGTVKKTKTEAKPKTKLRPALSPEARENRLISLSMDLAEQQLLDGTASSQIIVHYLKAGLIKERYEKEKLQNENELLKAKVEDLKSKKQSEEIYAEAIEAFKKYRGESYDED